MGMVAQFHKAALFEVDEPTFASTQIGCVCGWVCVSCVVVCVVPSCRLSWSSFSRTTYPISIA